MPGADRALVPVAADRLLLCAYGPGGAGPATGSPVARVVVTDRPSIDRLRSALDRLAPAPGGVLHCPIARGYAVLEVFTDTAREQAVEVRQTLDGCRVADNGHRTGWVGSSDAGRVLLSLLPAGYRQDAPAG